MAETHTVQGDRGVRLAVREWPSGGPSILLLHGLASSSHIWDLVAPRLAPRFRVVAYDQRGHGLSGKPSSGYGFDRLVADAAAVIRSLGLRRPVVVGHSWGANVALQLAWDRAELVSGDVLVDVGFLSMRDGMDWRTAPDDAGPTPAEGDVARAVPRGHAHLHPGGGRAHPRGRGGVPVADARRSRRQHPPPAFPGQPPSDPAGAVGTGRTGSPAEGAGAHARPCGTLGAR